jgi:predicted secreted protein
MKTRIALALFTVCLASPLSTPAKTEPQPTPIYPEIVRLSYVEGDVRIYRGKQNEKTTARPGRRPWPICRWRPASAW